MSSHKISIEWRPREPPLIPCAVAGRGQTAVALARRAAASTETKGLWCIAAGEWLLLSGAPNELPWADGAFYLGRDPHAPNLLLPTVRMPTVPVDLLARALSRRFPEIHEPIAVLALSNSVEVIPCGDAHVASSHDLNSWASKQAGVP
jgi:MoxR-vWA-beta-propeller ternary system domain bpX5